MKLVIGGVAQGKLDYVLENMIEKTEKYDVYDEILNAANYGVPQARRRYVLHAVRKDINNELKTYGFVFAWPWDFAVDDERIFIIDKFHYFIRAVLEKNLPLQEYILKFMQFAEENPDTIVIADEIGNGIVPLDAFEREYREQTGRAEILLAKKADEVVRVICGIGQKIK